MRGPSLLKSPPFLLPPSSSWSECALPSPSPSGEDARACSWSHALWRSRSVSK